LGFFDTLTDRISQSKTLSSNLFYLSATAVNPETGRLFGITAADQYSGDGVVMFNSAGTLLANIALPVTGAAGNSGTAYAQSVEVDPRTNLAFVSALTDSGVSLGSALYVIDGATNTVLRSTSFYSTFVTSVVGVNPDTGKVYVVYGTSPNSKFYLDVYSEQ
jgi:DNA-binding beta-propeller fold protein YncE